MDKGSLPVAGRAVMHGLLSEERDLFSPLWVVTRPVARRLAVDEGSAAAAEAQVPLLPSHLQVLMQQVMQRTAGEALHVGLNGLLCRQSQAAAAPAGPSTCAGLLAVGEGQEEPARIENAAFDLTPDLTPSQSPAKALVGGGFVSADNPLFH